MREPIPVVIDGKEQKLDTLFDSGSHLTLMGEKTLREFFGETSTKKLPQEKTGLTINGARVRIDSYVEAKMVIRGYPIVTIVYISEDIKRKVIINGKETKFPDLIIGILTIEDWHIELDFEQGKVKSCDGTVLVI